MNQVQIRTYFEEYNNKMNIPQVSPLSVSEEWLQIQSELNNQIPKENTRFTQYEDIMKVFTKWFQEQDPQFGLTSSAQPAAEANVQKQEEKQEEKVVLVIFLILFY